MRVVHLSYDYGLSGTSGALIAASRLHLALLRAGVDSHFVCVRQLGQGENVHRLPRNWICRTLSYLVPRVFWVFSKLMLGRMLMPNLWPLPGFPKLMRELKPDIIHVHWIGQDMVSFTQLEKVEARFVYTAHDLAPVNAIEPHPKNDCRFIEGFTNENSSRTERWMFSRKQKLLEAIKPVWTGPSDWVCGMLKESFICKSLSGQVRQDAASAKVLNIVDPAFRFDSNLVRPHEKFTILFGAFGGRSSPYKGWADLEDALRMLPDNVKCKAVVVVFGEDAAPYDVGGVDVHFLGPINSTADMLLAYHSADVFAFPSRVETQGMVKMESLMCGLPVVAFERAACAESLRQNENGWVAPDGDITQYAMGLQYFYELWKRGELNAMRPKIAREAAEEFAEDKIVGAMMNVYARVLEDSAGANSAS